jgi:hypothetical protein
MNTQKFLEHVKSLSDMRLVQFYKDCMIKSKLIEIINQFGTNTNDDLPTKEACNFVIREIIDRFIDKFSDYIINEKKIEKGTFIMYHCSSVIGACIIDDADLDFISQEGCYLEKIGNVFEESKEELTQKYINTCQSYNIFFKEEEENEKKIIIKTIEEYTKKNKK